MKVVLDTNVLMSGIFWAGVPAKILKAWEQHIIQLAVTPEILDEYSRVAHILAERHPHVDITPIIQLIVIHAEVYQTISLPEPVSPDPDDDKFIACAISAQTNIIISGDSDLLGISGYANIEVLKPAAFVKRFLN